MGRCPRGMELRGMGMRRGTGWDDAAGVVRASFDAGIKDAVSMPVNSIPRSSFPLAFHPLAARPPSHPLPTTRHIKMYPAPPLTLSPSSTTIALPRPIAPQSGRSARLATGKYKHLLPVCNPRASYLLLLRLTSRRQPMAVTPPPSH